MGRFIRVIIALSLLSLAGSAFAQTAEQLRQYQQLSPQQRAEIQKALQKTPQQSEQQPLEQPQVVTPPPPQAPQGPSSIEKRYADRTGPAHLRQPQAVREVDQQLKQFGYELFYGTPSTFAPATDIPVPADYVLGPGDSIQVQLFGKDNEEYNLVVSRDGRINFPELGAIPVAGLKFTELRADLEKRVSEQMIGVKASIAMGPLRSIRVFVLGDVTRPGSYTVSALSTMTNALFVSGGIKPIGSLRNVQLKRSGRVITRLDLYDLLLRGDTSDDARLQPGDVIFVPPIGQTAAVGGEVRRPAIYELRGENTVGQLVEIAGGLLPTAVPRLSQIERLDARGNVTLLDVNLDRLSPPDSSHLPPLDASRLSRLDASRLSPLAGRGRAEGAGEGQGPATPLADGDVLRIYQSLDRMDGVVLLAGHVRRPGGVAWHDHMRLTDLVGSPDMLLPQSDLDYVVVRREEKPLAKVSVFSTRLSAAWADPQSDANVLLEPRDKVFVFPLINPKEAAATQALPTSLVARTTDAEAEGDNDKQPEPRFEPAAMGAPPIAGSRQALLQPILDDLIAQSRSGEPTRIVSVGGLVREPGNYPLEANMHVADLIRAGGGLAEAAYTLGAEITRYSVSDGEKREISHMPVDLALVMQGDATANVALEAHDKLTIKRLPEWADQMLVQVKGEVRFPGSYPIKRGEHLSDLLQRAGGLTDQAFPEGSVFMREELRVKEQERFDTLAKQLESDIAALSLEKAQEDKSSDALATARTLLPQLKAARATGRLVIDLPDLMKEGAGSQYDVVLKGGDQLIVPAKMQEVTVIGEVQYPTSHLIEKGLDVRDYVDRSGGLTYKADGGRAYVVRANGQVVPAYSGWWIFRHQASVRAGDTIVVPLNVDRMRPLTFWTSVTQIVYHLAVTLAAIHTIGAI